jgi:hypothetical protein
MVPLYYAYGVFGFTFAFISIAVQFTMVDKYHFQPAENAYAWAIIALPWVFKPIYAVMSDKPIFGFRRSYISVAAFACAVLFAYSPTLVIGKKSMVAVLTICSLFLCIADVGCDSMLVEMVRHEPVKGTLQSRCWLARNVGNLGATCLSGFVYSTIGFEPVLRITSIPIFVLALCIWDIPEKHRISLPTKEIITSSLLAVKKMWKLLFFILIVNMVPEVSNILFYKLKQSNVGPNQMAIVSVAGSVSACATAAAYQLYKGGKGAIVVSLISGSVASSLALAISLGASAFEFAIARSAFMAIASMLLTLPIVIHTATLCPEGSEGTTYSIVMSWMNLTAILSESIEGLVTSAMGITDDNLSAMSYFCSVALMMSIVPFVFLKILPM